MNTKIPIGALAVCGAVILAGQIDLVAGGGAPQADVVLSDCLEISNWGAVGGIRGYSLGSNTCNIGDEDLLWGLSHSGTPALAMNAYRLESGRLLQIGLSNAKHSTFASAQPGCGFECNLQGGPVLGAGCRDIYTATFNGGQSRLGYRSEINPWTGVLTGPPGGLGNSIYRRLQIAEADLSGEAQFFVEGVYVALDDAGALGNGYNNSSHKRVTIGPNFDLVVTGSMAEGDPAILAWRDHGLGEGMPDPSVDVQAVDVPNEGRYYVVSKTTDVGGGSWLYDYAIFNLNSDRGAGSFSVPTGEAAISDIEFHDVDYHSGEVYDTTDWTGVTEVSSVVWTSPQTFEQNADSNALRWGTMYNFWFTANQPPADIEAEIGLFKPGAVSSVAVTVKGPSAPSCPEDLSGNGVVDFADIVALLAVWGESGGPEDLDGSGTVDFGDIVRVLAVWGPCS